MSGESIAAGFGFDWLLPYPRLIPAAIAAVALLFGAFKFSLGLMAASAERRLERNDGE